MKLTEAKRRVDRIRDHADAKKNVIATQDELELCRDFVLAAVRGLYGLNAQRTAKEIAVVFGIEFDRAHGPGVSR